MFVWFITSIATYQVIPGPALRYDMSKIGVRIPARTVLYNHDSLQKQTI